MAVFGLLTGSEMSFQHFACFSEPRGGALECNGRQHFDMPRLKFCKYRKDELGYLDPTLGPPISILRSELAMHLQNEAKTNLDRRIVL
jgi:hypothetical protein